MELIENGAEVEVTMANRQEYYQLASEARLNEHTQQVEAIRRGLGKIVPSQLLNLLTWRELELMVCGEAVIDVDLLQRHTEYRLDRVSVKWWWWVGVL